MTERSAIDLSLCRRTDTSPIGHEEPSEDLGMQLTMYHTVMICQLRVGDPGEEERPGVLL